MVSSSTLWKAAEKYYHEGLSVIWCRMEKEIRGAREYGPKSPIGSWKNAQLHRKTLEALSSEMTSHSIKVGIGVVTGKISGNLEAIDIDVAHWPGIDALFFSEIKTIYPDLFNRLLIHQSMSGGYHILYRCEEPINEGNKKLAIKRGQKNAGIETRGEGGFLLLPPSEGYSVFQDRTIPTIQRHERNSLISLAMALNQEVKVVSPTINKSQIAIYDENPFQHFDKSTEARELLLNHGWKLSSETNYFIHYTRPGKKLGISASFIKRVNRFYFFTTSSEFEANQLVSPSAALAALEFGKDYKELYRHLVSRGFGKVKPDHEQAVMKKAKAVGKNNLPANFSDGAKAELTSALTELELNHPHGLFWRVNEQGEYIINRIELEHTCQSLQLFQYNANPCQVIDNEVFILDEYEFFQVIKDYVRIEDEEEYKLVGHAIDSFLQRSGAWTLKNLKKIKKDTIFNSSNGIVYKIFNNCIVEITSSGINFKKISDFPNRLILHHDKLLRDFFWDETYAQGYFYEFLDKALNLEAFDKYVFKVLGYLAKGYKKAALEPYIVSMLDGVEAKKGGGTGKNLTIHMLKKFCSVHETPGEMFKADNSYLQTWNYESVMCISDPDKKFRFGFLKNSSSNDGIKKDLYKNAYTIPADEMPMFVVLSNFSWESGDGGLDRRIIPLEYSSFWNKDNLVSTYFAAKEGFKSNDSLGHKKKKHFLFPDDFDTVEWNRFDTFMIKCVQEYLIAGELKVPKQGDDGWKKRFLHNYGVVFNFIDDNIGSWVEEGTISNSYFLSSYEVFCVNNNIPKLYMLSSMKLNDALEEYCDRHNIYFNKDVLFRERGVVERRKSFKQLDEFGKEVIKEKFESYLGEQADLPF